MGSSHPKVTRTPDRQGNEQTKYSETFGQLEVSFSNDQKVITVYKTSPTLAVHLHFCLYIFTLYQHFQSPRLVFSCSAIEESSTSRKLLRVVIGTPLSVFRRFQKPSGMRRLPGIAWATRVRRSLVTSTLSCRDCGTFD